MSKRSDQGKRRTRGREQALQLLFMQDFAEGGVTDVRDIAPVMDDVVIEEYAAELFKGIRDHAACIDAAIEDASENWSIARMALTDKSILRIATYELLYQDDVPSGVAINEAVELAQRFGGEDDSFRFVNGVLGKISAEVEAGVDFSDEGGAGRRDADGAAACEGDDAAAETTEE